MMRLIGLMLLATCIAVHGKAQQVESIEFHLYTDSLKKGVYNYINVDGKMSDGSWRPLNSKTIQFSSNTGKWDGNSLIIDSSYVKDSVVITATVKANPSMQKTIIIYMKRNLIEPKLKTEEELLNDWDNNTPKRKRGRQN